MYATKAVPGLWVPAIHAGTTKKNALTHWRIKSRVRIDMNISRWSLEAISIKPGGVSLVATTCLALL